MLEVRILAVQVYASEEGHTRLGLAFGRAAMDIQYEVVFEIHGTQIQKEPVSLPVSE